MPEPPRMAASFDWRALRWEAPEEPPGDACGYCEAPIAAADAPLLLWTEDGWRARFCGACQARWWGFGSLTLGGRQTGA